MLVDYDYYASDYNGNAVPQDLFDNLSIKSEQYLRYYANGKIEECDNEVKDCICEMIEELLEDELTPSGSESLGGWSVSNNGTKSKALSSKLNNTIQQRLGSRKWACRWL